MSKPKREFDKVSHSATGRVDTQKKGGHGTWGSDKEQIEQGKKEYEGTDKAAAGGKGAKGNEDPSNLRDLNQMGGDDVPQNVSYAEYLKSQSKAAQGGAKPFVVKEHKMKKKGTKQNKNRTQAQKVTDSLFAGNDQIKGGNKNKNKRNKNKPKPQNANVAGTGNNKNDTVKTVKSKDGNNNNVSPSKPKNRKAKEVLMTSVSYEDPSSQRGGRGRGGGYRGGMGGRGRGRGRGGYNNYNDQGGYGSYNSNRAYGRGGGGFGSRRRGRGGNLQVDNNFNRDAPTQNTNAPKQQYRRVDNSNNANNANKAAGNASNQPNAQ